MVTGGGSGIGREIARKFAAHGAWVRVLDISLSDAEATCHQIVSSGGNATAFHCDVGDQAEVKALFQQLRERELLILS